MARIELASALPYPNAQPHHEPAGQSVEPLPGIQDLRKHFHEVVSGQDDSVARAFLLLTELERLKPTVDIAASHVHSRLFLDSVEAFTHNKLADYYRGNALSSPPESASAFRTARFRHLLGYITARRAMQADMAQILMQSGPAADRKTYTRTRGIVSSANFLYPDDESGLANLGFRSIITEHAILDGLREQWPTSHYSDPLEDAKLAVDVYAGVDDGAEQPLQVKYSNIRGRLYRKGGYQVPVVIASPDFEREPFKFDSKRIKILRGIVEKAISRKQGRVPESSQTV